MSVQETIERKLGEGLAALHPLGLRRPAGPASFSAWLWPGLGHILYVRIIIIDVKPPGLQSVGHAPAHGLGRGDQRDDPTRLAVG